MKDAPSVGAIVEIEGDKWTRIFTIPQAAPNGLKPIDPRSSKQFVEKTGAMKGTVGDMLDLSKELSEKRAEKMGTDPVKDKFYKDYSAKRRGVKHTAQLAEEQKKAQKKLEKALAGLGLSAKTI